MDRSMAYVPPSTLPVSVNAPVVSPRPQFVIARTRTGAVYPAQVIQRARRQMAALERGEDGKWCYKELVYPSHQTIVQELVGGSAEEAFSPAVLEEFLTPAATRGDELDEAEARGDVSQAGGDETLEEAEDVDVVQSAQDWDDAESVSVCNIAAIYLVEENAAKGHLDVTRKNIQEGTHDGAMSKELARWSELGVIDQTDTPPPGINAVSTRWVYSWKLKDGARIAKARLVAQVFKDHRDIYLFRYCRQGSCKYMFMLYYVQRLGVS
eukprot:GHVR01047594.1.p1 GENE.GHVR01047594.1~~GHVR01047594.1.p1  ORF type:complete len:267 (-),score=48.75 GHVR01047594.1:90-890(-)